MRKLAVALCLTATALTALGQGTINFATRWGASDPPVNAQVTLGGTAVAGADYLAQLYVDNAGSLTAVGDPVAFSEGARAGYVSGGEVSVPFVAPGANATIVMRAWATASGADYEEAAANPAGILGESGSITIALGGVGTPPGPAADLIGLQGFELQVVPEPSTIALGLLGLAALALRRRK